MTKITMNKANKIRSLLEAKVKDFRGAPYFVRTVKTFTTNPFSVVQKGVDEVRGSNVDETHRRVELVKFLYELRLLISNENQKSGIGQCINHIAYLNSLIMVLTSNEVGLGYNETPYKLSDYETVQKSYITSPGLHTISVSVYTPEDQKEIEENKENLKKQLRDAEENRNELNHMHYLEIPSEMEAFLKAQKLL